MAPVTALLVFASTPDVMAENFVVPILAEPLDRLAGRAAALGFDGLEFLPDPDACPDPVRIGAAAEAAGVTVGVINSGRMRAKGYALLHHDREMRQRSMAAFKRLIDLAGALGARVGLGLARGEAGRTVEGADLAPVMRDAFSEVAEHAVRRRTVVMLEPADPGYVAAILRVAEAVAAARATASPGFRIMLDTYQLDQVEASIAEGFGHADGMASHIHLYDPEHWPPGVRPDGRRLDWALIRRSMEATGFTGTGSTVLAPEGDRDALARASTGFLRAALMEDHS